MHERHRKRRYVALAGVGFQLLQHFARFVGPSGLRKNVAPERDRLAVTAREPRRIRERFQREIGFTRTLVRLSELHVPDLGFIFTNQERADLVAFLKAL